MSAFFVALVGGLVTGAMIPITSYFTIRYINYWWTTLIIEPKILNKEDKYDTIAIRVRNNSWATLKNVIPYIDAHYHNDSVKPDLNYPMYSTKNPNRQTMLSWAKAVDGGNHPETNINQLEEPDLNLFRFHYDIGGIPRLEIASEDGFSNRRGAKGRVLIEFTTDLHFEILITAENMHPKKKRYVLHQNSLKIVELTN